MSENKRFFEKKDYNISEIVKLYYKSTDGDEIHIIDRHNIVDVYKVIKDNKITIHMSLVNGKIFNLFEATDKKIVDEYFNIITNNEKYIAANIEAFATNSNKSSKYVIKDVPNNVYVKVLSKKIGLKFIDTTYTKDIKEAQKFDTQNQAMASINEIITPNDYKPHHYEPEEAK